MKVPQNSFCNLDLLFKYLTTNIYKHYYWSLLLCILIHLFFYKIDIIV